ncbi:SCO2521 family protein [Catenulispora subtropica]|uniref:Uncharacterized protein n=1 Tax=Catenulispora subtropica TaxID=450798 RepID=A0ABP5CNQ4_9ACTN
MTAWPDVSPDVGEQPGVVLGAVTTRLLNSSEPLPLEPARQALALLPDVAAGWRRHPIEQVVSPDLFFSLDCRLATRSGSHPRVIGTARARAVLTAGHVLQGSASTAVVLNASRRRLPWAHYVARTGMVEAINKADPADLVTSFLRTEPGGTLLDLGKTASYVTSLLDRVPQIDGRARLRTQSSRLLWAARLHEGSEPVGEVEAGADGVFRVRLSTPSALLPHFIEFCEVLALHGWLLAAMKNAFDRSTRPGRRAEDEMDPALSYLAHIWNPRAHLPPEVRWLWQALEDEAQLTWEWQSTVTRLRDKVALLTRKAMEETLRKEVV